MSLINFPGLHVIKGRVYYGGLVFESKEALREWMSDKDWRRRVAWESRNLEWLERRWPSRDTGTGGGTAA